MTRAIIRFSAHNRFLVLLATTVAVAYGIYTLQHIPVDAIPDLSDTQVIIYSRWDRSPDIIEDQVTYPIVSAMLGTPNVKTIRGFSDFGFSYVYVIFQDGTDIYWARSRVLEYLSKIQPVLPEGVKTEMGPDATGVGWVFNTRWWMIPVRSRWRTSAPSRTGTCGSGCSRWQGSPRSRPSGDTSSSTRSPLIPFG
jgi:Cu(I)/Ag(I) efflux system membrane protein CusA/SilA